MPLMKTIARFAASPQGRRMFGKAKAYAASPEGRAKIEQGPQADRAAGEAASPSRADAPSSGQP